MTLSAKFVTLSHLLVRHWLHYHFSCLDRPLTSPKVIPKSFHHWITQITRGLVILFHTFANNTHFFKVNYLNSWKIFYKCSPLKRLDNRTHTKSSRYYMLGCDMSMTSQIWQVSQLSKNLQLKTKAIVSLFIVYE